MLVNIPANILLRWIWPALLQLVKRVSSVKTNRTYPGSKPGEACKAGEEIAAALALEMAAVQELEWTGHSCQMLPTKRSQVQTRQNEQVLVKKSAQNQGQNWAGTHKALEAGVGQATSREIEPEIGLTSG